MDDIVKAALKKWPNVPACYGWLALDARGDWYMRDDQVQAAGPFPEFKGSRIEHDKLLDFIGRNYAADADGNWFFQNGPQRVFVQLEASPWVWRLQATGDTARDLSRQAITITSHTGLAAAFESAWLDEGGRLFLATDLGFGLVHTLDVEIASYAVERGDWVTRDTTFEALPARFGYRLAPSPNAR